MRARCGHITLVSMLVSQTKGIYLSGMRPSRNVAYVKLFPACNGSSKNLIPEQGKFILYKSMSHLSICKKKEGEMYVLHMVSDKNCFSSRSLVRLWRAEQKSDNHWFLFCTSPQRCLPST